MKVAISVNNGPEQQAELFALGSCLGLQVDEKQIIRIALTKEQWKLLSKSSAERSGKN